MVCKVRSLITSVCISAYLFSKGSTVSRLLSPHFLCPLSSTTNYCISVYLCPAYMPAWGRVRVDFKIITRFNDWIPHFLTGWLYFPLRWYTHLRAQIVSESTGAEGKRELMKETILHSSTWEVWESLSEARWFQLLFSPKTNRRMYLVYYKLKLSWKPRLSCAKQNKTTACFHHQRKPSIITALLTLVNWNTHYTHQFLLLKWGQTFLCHPHPFTL